MSSLTKEYTNPSKTIVFIVGSIPTFDKDSGSNRLTEIILSFKDIGFNCIIYINGLEQDEDKYLSLFREKQVEVKISGNRDSSVCCNYLNTLEKIDYIWFYGPNTFKRYFDDVHKNFKSVKKIYDMIDVHHLRLRRAIKLNILKISNYNRYFKYKSIEYKALKSCDYIIAISEEEKTYLKNIYPNAEIIVISNVHYTKISKNEVPNFEQRQDLLFIGSTHRPNIDAVKYLYKDIMPKVWESKPNIKVNIIGNVNEVVKNIEHPNFVFKGFVEDIKPYFLNSKIMVAPLRYGAGVKGKVGQAYEYYLPVITTSIGGEGMNLAHNKNVLIANDARSFANEILNLYDNERLWGKLSDNSTKVLDLFSKTQLSKTLSIFSSF